MNICSSVDFHVGVFFHGLNYASEEWPELRIQISTIFAQTWHTGRPVPCLDDCSLSKVHDVWLCLTLKHHIWSIFKAVSLVFLAWHLARCGLQQDMSQRWKAPLQHCGRVGRCIQWPLGFKVSPCFMFHHDQGWGMARWHQASGVKEFNRNRYQPILIEDFNETLSIWQTLWSFSAVPEERSRTSFHGAGHIPWTMSSVPLSDGRKSPTKMHRTSSCGCASSVTTSIGSKRRLQREAVVVTTCDNSKVAVHNSVFACDHGFTMFCKEHRVDYASHVRWMHHQDISRPNFFDRWALCILWVMTGLSLHGQSWPWRPRKQEAMISKKSSNPIWWKRDICWCCSIPLCQGLICLSILSDESVWVHVST